MARYNDRNYERENERFGRRDDYGSNRSGTGSDRGRFTNDVSDRDYGYENDTYFGGGSTGYGRGFDSGEVDYGSGNRSRRGRRENFETDDYGSSSFDRGRNFGGQRDFERDRTFRETDYDRNYGFDSGRNDRERRYEYGNEGFYGGYSGRRGNFDRDHDRSSGRYYTDRGRESNRREREDRGWFEKAADEVASWFGSDEQEGFRGKGTKNYQRSDDRISEDVNDRLSDDYYLDASDIEVKVKDKEVTLSGTIRSKYDKRRAEDIADSVSGVEHVQNNLRVSTPSDVSAETTETTTKTGLKSKSATGS